MKLVNGGVYNHGYRRFVLVYINGNKWAMLHIERHATKCMSCPMFQYNGDGQFMFSEDELMLHWDSNEWELLDGRLRIEKIDDLSFVEYPNGNLNAME